MVIASTQGYNSFKCIHFEFLVFIIYLTNSRSKVKRKISRAIVDKQHWMRRKKQKSFKRARGKLLGMWFVRCTQDEILLWIVCIFPSWDFKIKISLRWHRPKRKKKQRMEKKTSNNLLIWNRGEFLILCIEEGFGLGSVRCVHLWNLEWDWNVC